MPSVLKSQTLPSRVPASADYVELDAPVLVGIAWDQIDRVWHRVRPFIVAALLHADGKYTARGVHQDLLNRRMQLWCAFGDKDVEAALVTEIRNYERKRVCNLMFCGGIRLERWLYHIETVEEWAKSQGCQAVEIWGRNGWRKVLPDYQPIHTVIRKTL